VHNPAVTFNDRNHPLRAALLARLIEEQLRTA